MRTRNALGSWVLASGFSLATLGVAAFAQAPAPSQEVRIEANKVVMVTEGRYPTQTQKVQLSRTLNYADFDLASNAGAKELKDRIHGTAEQICAQLEKLYPPSSMATEMNDRTACVKEAFDNAIGKVPWPMATAGKTKQR